MHAEELGRTLGDSWFSGCKAAWGDAEECLLGWHIPGPASCCERAVVTKGCLGEKAALQNSQGWQSPGSTGCCWTLFLTEGCLSSLMRDLTDPAASRSKGFASHGRCGLMDCACGVLKLLHVHHSLEEVDLWLQAAARHHLAQVLVLPPMMHHVRPPHAMLAPLPVP
mmetsp:Transcript_20787/g.36629  ORF Transcript_20787/g.36629 Transcript_20787/m.36629 type:complete len:167 (-) Transcript_20787:35-535(-)